MKNIWIAGAVAALSLVVGSQQRAEAQCCPPQCTRGGEISFNAGVTLGCHWTPCHGHWEPNCCGPYCAPYGPYGYAGAPPYAYPPPYGFARRPPVPPAPPGGPGAPPPPPPPPGAKPDDVQNIGYNYPVSYDPNYGYNYGVPYYQDPGYWYGYGYGYGQ